MRVIHEDSDRTQTSITSIDIDAWRLVDVEVRREWRNIDLLLILNLADGERWTVCIENKINSLQHSNQLHRYRACVETEFPEARRKLFILLTKSDEAPDDDHYVSASYTQVHQALKECLASRSHAIGSQPKVLLENYLRLLEQKFMDESEIARTALRIYQQHRRALDVIFEHRPDRLGMASARVLKLLTDHAEDLGILMAASTKFYIRFIPRAWEQPGNTHGSAWPGSDRTLVFELNLSGKRPYLYVTAGKPPVAWIDPIWQRSRTSPFRPSRRAMRPKLWFMLHLAGRIQLSLEEEEFTDSNDIAQKIFDWCVTSYRTPDTQEKSFPWRTASPIEALPKSKAITMGSSFDCCMGHVLKGTQRKKAP